ncbi:phytanoyl-CoA dioxygenase family protein [Oceanibacterium hippocampi]|uniref:Phytanoyl-CoA dioxygenase (PhyH) n=1 Tax=Oceanibacterium hippocampi TaxID=745714 RepID=A0A1Y5S0B4_9PROT|nr:phytanoyl-CoA dioxygenase family protein [Oceanibacterium hippocampi]SLN29555.1 Phytanoyl-CoA dioxygenase (PhyH) [Oceanibacterium hippocampi]
MNRHPGNPITADDRAAYARDGVVCLRAMFDDDWIDFMRGWVDQAIARPGPHAEDYAKGGGRFFGDLDMARRHAGFRAFVHDSPAAEIAGRLMGTARVNFFYDQLLVKEPGTTERTPWHQDQPYWAVAGQQVCSIWLPFDPVPPESALEYVAGSHDWPEFSPYHFADGTPYAGTGLPPLPDIEAGRERHRIVSFAMEPGDCLVFQAMVVHGAPGNRSGLRRRVLSTRWTGDDVRYCLRPGEVAIPTRDPGLAHGDVMDCADLPLVWRRGD